MGFPKPNNYLVLADERPTVSVSVENAEIWEENRNEIVIEDLLEVSEEDIGIVLQKW